MKMQWIASLSSVILPGTGQLINHEWAKGGVFLVMVLILSGMLRRKSFFLSEFGDGSMVHILLLVVLLGLAAWSAVDAYRASRTLATP